MNVPTLLTTIRLLMAHPNGDDGLMPDIVSFEQRQHVREEERGRRLSKRVAYPGILRTGVGWYYLYCSLRLWSYDSLAIGQLQLQIQLMCWVGKTRKRIQLVGR